MSCSRLSWFFAATAIRRQRRSPCPRAPPGRPARGRRRSRPRRRRPRRGRRRSRQLRASISGSSPAPYAPGLEPKMRVVARRRSPCPALVGQRQCAADEVLLGRLVEVGHQPAPRRRAARRRAGTRRGRSRRCARSTSMRGRPSSSSGHHLEADHAAGLVVPDRPDAQQREHLGDVVALGAHGAGAPDGEADRRAGSAPVSARWRRDQRVGQRRADVPRVARRDRLRVDRVEVPPGRQHVDQPAGRRPGRAGRDVAALERAQHVGHLVGGAGEPGHDLGGGELQHPHDIGRSGRQAPPPPRAGPSRRASRRCPSPATSRRASVSMQVDRRPRPFGPARPRRRECRGRRRGRPGVGQQQLLVEPERGGQGGAQARQRSPAAPDLGGAQHGEHRVDPLLARGCAAQNVQTVADLHVLDLAQVAVHVQDERVERPVSSGCSSRCRSWCSCGRPDQRPDLRPHAPGSFAGSSA